MNPFYFGDSKNPLFGVFHAPQSEAGMDMAIVICPPVVHEYIRTHRALRQLAMALSANGFPVMRFDYFGVGDSAGESGEGGTERWALDIKSAIDEGMSHSNKRNVCLIGLRLGAALALKAVSTATSCTALILWEPIISGYAMLEEFKKIHVSTFPHSNMEGQPGEILGFPYPSLLEGDLKGLDMLTIKPLGVKNALILHSHNHQFNSLQRHLSDFIPSCVQLPFSDKIDWTAPKDFDKTFIAGNAIDTIVSVLKERFK